MAKHWYILHTYSGYENKVKHDLEHRIETFGLENQVVDIRIPTEEIIEVKDGGSRKSKESKVFPGYVFVRMEVDDNSWAVVRNTPGVTGFVGMDGKPTPLRRSEFRKVMERASAAEDATPKHVATNLEPGMPIRVVSGPLTDYDGTVVEVMPEVGKVRVMIPIFGRDTPAELTLAQVTTKL